MDRRIECNNMIADRIKQMLKEKGWSQEILAGKLQTLGVDYSRGSISMVERKERPPAAILIPALKYIFDCEYSDFFSAIESEFDQLTK